EAGVHRGPAAAALAVGPEHEHRAGPALTLGAPLLGAGEPLRPQPVQRRGVGPDAARPAGLSVHGHGHGFAAHGEDRPYPRGQAGGSRGAGQSPTADVAHVSTSAGPRGETRVLPHARERSSTTAVAGAAGGPARHPPGARAVGPRHGPRPVLLT